VNDSIKPVTAQQMSRFWVRYAIIGGSLMLVATVLMVVGPQLWPEVPILGSGSVLLPVGVAVLEGVFMTIFIMRVAKRNAAYRALHPEEFPPSAGSGPGDVPNQADPYQNITERSRHDW
jgi:hypothetical protein